MIAWTWGIAWPAGLLGWLVLWFTIGGKSGIPDASVMAIALACWLIWLFGLDQVSSPGTARMGLVVCAVALAILVSVRLAIPQGTGLLLLDIAGAVLGIPFFYVAKRGTESEQRVVALPITA